MTKTEKGLRSCLKGQVAERLSLWHQELEKITPIAELEETNGQKMSIFCEENLKKILTRCFKYSVMDISV